MSQHQGTETERPASIVTGMGSGWEETEAVKQRNRVSQSGGSLPTQGWLEVGGRLLDPKALGLEVV